MKRRYAELSKPIATKRRFIGVLVERHRYLESEMKSVQYRSNKAQGHRYHEMYALEWAIGELNRIVAEEMRARDDILRAAAFAATLGEGAQ